LKQVTLFGEKVLTQREKEVEEHNKKCEEMWKEKKMQGEQNWMASFPCKKALEYPVGEHRHYHMKNCEECKRLERELDLKVGITNHIYS